MASQAHLPLFLAQAAGKMTRMANGKDTKNASQPIRRVVIRNRLYDAAVALADKHDSGVTDVVNAALRVYLEREGMWPPPPAKSETERG